MLASVLVFQDTDTALNVDREYELRFALVETGSLPLKLSAHITHRWLGQLQHDNLPLVISRVMNRII